MSSSCYFKLQVFFICEGTSRHAILRTLRDSLFQLADADAKYQKTIDKYNTFNVHNDLNNDKMLMVIPIDDIIRQNKRIARVNYDIKLKIDDKANIVQRNHEARMKEIIDFMKDHMMTTKYLHDEVRRIKRTRQVKDRLREMVTFLEKPERHSIKQKILTLFTFILKHHHYGKQPNIWDQKMNDVVINVIKDPFNDGVIN